MSWLQASSADEQNIQQLQKKQPELYAYAQVLALALRIDSRLLRNLRLRFLPKSSVELETELWSSPLIHTRNVQAAVMYSGIARALSDALKAENLERFISAKAELSKLTQHWSETDRVEQEIRWAVLENDEQILKKNVQRILKALTLAEGDFEKRELARWVKGALPILKATTHVDTEQQWLSQYVVASLGLAGKWWAEDVDVLQPLPTVLINALPKAKPQKIGLRLRLGVLEVLTPEDELEMIEICVPLPTIVRFEFKTEMVGYGKNIKTQQIEPFWIGRLISIPTNIQGFNLYWLDGVVHQVAYKKQISGKIFISYDHKDEIWKNRLQTHLAVLEMEGLLSVWDDRQIAWGDRWYPEIETALNTADVAILLISADFLTSKFIRGEEIPRLLKRREQEGIRVIPLIIKPCPWKTVAWLNAMQGASRDNVELSGLSEHEQDTILSKLAEQIHDLLKAPPQPNTPKPNTITPSIKIDRLPTVKGDFFGRRADLKLLNDAWTNRATHIVQLIAPGGTGKTKLLRHWINHTPDIPNLIAWSFYSQGISENKQISVTPFFEHAFEKLGSPRKVADFVNEADNKHVNRWKDMGEYLADLLRERRCVLVLDGLEPLQHANNNNRGSIKDSAIRHLLKSLAIHNTSLCIITVRIAVYELIDYLAPQVISHRLQNISLSDGVSLLQSLGVHGSLVELRKAVREYGSHPLALSMLGNLLRLCYQGDVLKRNALKNLSTQAKSSQESHHVFKVMQAYEEWFADTPELALLYLLGLFDHPISESVLQVLWDTPIPDLTVGLENNEWQHALSVLREEHRLLAQQENGKELDCHPLIREYFGRQLRDKHPQAWQQAHEALYTYYKTLPHQEQPDTLAEMQPLFHAIQHGCQANLHQQVFDEIYWPRISREKQYYLNKKGFIGDDLAVLTHFFTQLWVKPSPHLNEETQAHVLQSVGHRLRALGKLAESIKAFTAVLKLYESLDDTKEVAITTSNLIESQLTLGDVEGALKSADRAAHSDDPKFIRRLQTFSIFARTLHQAGRPDEAYQQFIAAEEIQRQYEPHYSRLHSLSSFRFCELLLEQEQFAEVEGRARYALDIALASDHPLYIGLHQLLIGRLNLLNQHLLEAEQWLSKASDSLQEAGNQDHLPRAYLAQAALCRHQQNFEPAHAHLREMFNIAQPAGMRLHLTDYHLEMARLLIAEGGGDPLNYTFSGEKQATSSVTPNTKKTGKNTSSKKVTTHITEATKLITSTGYYRRTPELTKLKQCLA